MMPQTEATIYLSVQRGCSQNALYRSFHTFNFGSYAHAHRRPESNLLVFNDDTLGGGHAMTYTADEDSFVLLIPVVGGVGYRRDQNAGSVAEAGQTHMFYAAKDASYQLYNPYPHELINFLHLRIRAAAPNAAIIEQAAFDLDTNPNRLLPFLDPGATGLAGYIGKFGGRHEGQYKTMRPDGYIFAFVIEGVFEIQNRLLESRDGLALRHCQEIEFEALSSGAIVLILEV